MPHHKSAVKRLRTSERDRRQNMAVKSQLRKQIKNFRENPEQGDLPKIYAHLDRAARKGVIPTSRADRLKARLAHHAAKA